jgi:hypothetical protein
VASIPPAAQYYLGGATHVANKTRLQRRHRMRRAADGRRPNGYSGLPLVIGLEEFATHQGARPCARVVADRGRLGAVDAR